MHPSIKIKLLTPRATIPAYHSELAAGLDLSACLTPEQEAAGGIILDPVVRGGRPVLVPLGFAIALPAGFEAQVRPRSGLASKFGVTMPNAPGTVDADYRGEMMVPLINLGQQPYTVVHGARIAQMVIARVEHAVLEETDELDPTRRGAAGFGSTGGHEPPAAIRPS